MADNFRNRFKDIQKLICGNIHIFQSDNDPYVEQSQARYIQNNIGGEILLLSNRGHFEGRKNNPINDTFPEIFERLKKSERHETKI